MRSGRLGLWAGIVVLALFLTVTIAGAAKHYGYGSNFALDIVIVAIVLVFLIAAGNILYGPNSHYARAQARTREAQQAANRAADEAHAARRAAASPNANPAPDPRTPDHP